MLVMVTGVLVTPDLKKLAWIAISSRDGNPHFSLDERKSENYWKEYTMPVSR